MRSENASLALQLPAIASMPWHHRRLVDHLARLQRGSLRVRIGRSKPFVLHGSEPGPSGEIDIRRPAALMLRLFWRGDLGFGEAFIAQDWDSPNPAALLELLALNLDAYAGSDARSGLAQAVVSLRHRMNRNTRNGSRRNIAAHYDLGNDFYAQWLDGSMTYSSALFDQGGGLAEGQMRKYQHLFELIDPKPGEHILEIGCGWGGFAEYAARRGAQVIGITLSAEQLAYAQQRIRDAGLQDRVEFVLRDYRDVDIQVDHVASIEMFEAVGQEYWQGYFETLARCLKPGGRAGLQVITIDEDRFERYASTPGGFIQTHIFPGGMLPTKTHLQQLGADAGLTLGAIDGFGQDYAATLAHWYRAFNRCEDWLEDNGYDERFRRLWQYYLVFCEAGFRARHIDVVQCLLQKPA